MLDKNKAAGISSQYSKRFLENFYNKLSEGGLLDRFKNLDAVSQHILEFISYLSATSLGEKMETGGFIKKTLGEVIKDAPSEIFKRIYNNLEQSEHPTGNQSGGKNFIDNFLGLEKEDAIRIIDWIANLDEVKKDKVLKHLKSLSLKKMEGLAKYNPEEKEKLENFLNAITPNGLSKKFEGPLKEFNDELEARIRKW